MKSGDEKFGAENIFISLRRNSATYCLLSHLTSASLFTVSSPAAFMDIDLHQLCSHLQPLPTVRLSINQSPQTRSSLLFTTPCTKCNRFSTSVFTAVLAKEALVALAWYVTQSHELQEAFLSVMNTFAKD